MTTLRNIIGGMDLEQALTSRDEINNALRGVLDEATGRWGIRVNRVELKGIDPPPSIKDSMEKQMRADRDKRAAILTAEGMRQSQILTAEGQKQSAILTAEGDREAVILRAQGDRESRILRAQGEGQAILTVFQSIHDGSARPGACWPTSTCRCCRRSPRATPTRSGSSRARSARRWRASAARSAPSRASRTRPTGPRHRVDYGAPVDAQPGGVGAARHARSPRPTRRSPQAIAVGARRPRTRGTPRRLAGAARRRTEPPPAASAERPVLTTSRRSRLASDPARGLAVFAAGIGAGTINTIVGSGTLITFPTLLAVGYPPVLANVSNTVGLVPGGVSGVLGLPARAGGPARRG